MRKKYVWALAAAMILSSMGQNVYASENLDISIEKIKVDQEVSIWVNQNQGADFTIDNAEVQLQVNGTQGKIEEVEFFSQKDAGIAYECMIDISGSMDQERIDKAKEVIRKLAEKKREKDTMSISTLGNQVVSSEFFTSKEDILAYLDTVQVTKEDTNLYQGITQALQTLQKENQGEDKKVLLIFSDGADDQAVGITKDEAISAVKESKIPVFTVALLKPEPSDEQIESAKVLGSFSRYSVGGVYYAPVIDGTDLDSLDTKIEEMLDHSVVLTVSMDEIPDSKEKISFQVSVKNQEQEDSDTIEEFVKKKAENVSDKPQKGEKNENAEKEVVPTVPVKEEFPVALLAGMVAVVVVLLVVVIFAINRGRKKKKKALEASEQQKKQGVWVSLREKNSSESESYKVHMRGKLQIGRADDCQICLSKDSAVSAHHCVLSLEQGKVYIIDTNSTNGTFVNGRMIPWKVMLSNQDVLLIGAREYVITWGQEA